MHFPFRDVPAFRRNPLTLLTDRAHATDQGQGFVPLALGLRPIYLCNSPQATRSILKWPTRELDKGSLVQRLRPIMGQSLLTNNGDAHKASKTAIHRHLQRNAISGNIEKMIAIVNGYIAGLATQKPFRPTNISAPLALQMGATALFGHDVLDAADRMALIAAVQTVESELAADMFRVLPNGPRKAAERSQRIDGAREIVAAVINRARASNNRSPLLLALEEAGLSDEQVNAELLGLLIAGHHTTGASISWMFYKMALDPSLADVLAYEADSVMQDLENGDSGALRRAPLSESFVKETLRVYPAGWWTSREFLQSAEVEGRKFRRGDMVMISPWVLHKDPRNWEQPEEFRLDRDYSHPSYMPFGVGGRSCIGMAIAMFELQLVALQFASAFSLSGEFGAVHLKPHPSVTLLAPDLELSLTTRDERKFRQTEAVA